MAAIKRRKPAAVRKTVFLRVRISEAQDAEFKEAAEAAGITVSAWATERLLAAARAERRKREAADG
ncbi:MAG TPA: hypothetical protein VHE35_08860 [Kofleriaceae bacterium]|nr:hypothetical protein [Kofleriaceae bacterium]